MSRGINTGVAASRRIRPVREAGKYYAIFRAELRQQTTYIWDFVLNNGTIVLFFYVLLQVWKITVPQDHISALPGERFTWEELIWFLAAGQILYFSVQTNAQLEIEHDVLTGNIVVTLARPYDYLLARFASVMSHTLLSFAVAFPVGCLMAWIISGSIAITPLGVVAFLMAFVARTLLFFMLQAIAGLATFWLERSTAFVWIIGLLILIFGGGFVPLGYWSPTARLIAELTPFPAMMYYPAKLFAQPSLETFLAMLLHGGIWLVILGAIVSLIYTRALKRLDLNGG